VTQQAGAVEALLIHVGDHVLGHGGIIHGVCMGRASMIAQIQAVDFPAVLKPLVDAPKVLQGTEKPV
jgi:hypothetical protein